MTNKKLKDKADKLFSLYIRLKYSDWKGFCTCYTCGKTDHYKKMQCGHFISRKSNKLRFDERNARVQCVGCNVFKHGNYIEYTTKMQEEGSDVEGLKKEGKESHPLSLKELEEICENLNKKLKPLETKK